MKHPGTVMHLLKLELCKLTCTTVTTSDWEIDYVSEQRNYERFLSKYNDTLLVTDLDEMIIDSYNLMNILYSFISSTSYEVWVGK